MNPRVRRGAIALVGIAFCLLAFYLASTRSFEFAVAEYIREFLHRLPASLVVPVFSHLPIDEDPAAWIVRKAASVVFFGAVGVLVRAVVGRRLKNEAGRAWLIVAAAVVMSAAIEAYEWPERLGEIAFDLVCGAVGGLIGVAVLRLFRRL